jgi:hypothetical protein
MTGAHEGNARSTNALNRLRVARTTSTWITRALFIGVAMTLMILIIGVFGPKTLNETLEEISY